MHVAVMVDPMLPVPPRLGGIERIIDLLVWCLVERGHEVTLFTHADSEVPCRHVPYSGTDAPPFGDALLHALRRDARSVLPPMESLE